jgi:ABC-type dipeptide/oligopeptide/nickel transport system permease component
MYDNWLDRFVQNNFWLWPAVLVVLSNLLADILYAAMDPRIRFN